MLVEYELLGFSRYANVDCKNYSDRIDSNLAERDLRMAKVKQKILRTFRSSTGVNAFTRICGYVSTVRKQSKNALDCIESVFTVNPIDPTLA